MGDFEWGQGTDVGYKSENRRARKCPHGRRCGNEDWDWLYNGNGLNRKYIRNIERQFSYCHRRKLQAQKGKKIRMNRVILEWSKGIHEYSSLLIYPDRSKFTEVLLCICTHRHIIPSSPEVLTSSYFSDSDTDDECLRKEAIYAWLWEQPVPNEAGQRIPWGTNPRKKKKKRNRESLSFVWEGRRR